MFRLLSPWFGSRSVQRNEARHRAVRNRRYIPPMLERLEERAMLAAITAVDFGNASSISGDRIAFVADERWSRDINGDGLHSTVLAYHDITSGMTTGTSAFEPAGSTTAISGDRIAFVDEHGLAAYHDLSSGVTTKLYIPTVQLAIHGDRLVVSTGLDDSGNWLPPYHAPYAVLAYHNMASGTTSTIATSAPDSTPGYTSSIFGDVVAFVSEYGNLTYHNIASGLTTDAGVAASKVSNTSVFGNRIAFVARDGSIAHYDITTGITQSLSTDGGSPSLSGDRISFTTSESTLGQDVDGDGFLTGRVVAYHDISTGTTKAVALTHGESVISGNRIAFDSSEATLGRDINGDGLLSNSPVVAYYTIGEPPVANPGGPYSVVEGYTVLLDGTGSTDNSTTPLVYEWDLDGDGEHDDATGATPTFSAATLAAGSYVVSLKVIDDEGLSHTASTTVEVITAAAFVDNTVTSVSTQVADLNSTGVLTNSQATSLLGKLDSAKASLDSGNTSAAVGKITATVLQIDAILKQKKTSTETADALSALSAELDAALAVL